MPGEKKLFLSATYRVYNPVDLSKKWFVYWYENGNRKRKYGNINQGTTYQDRMSLSEATILELKKKQVSRKLSKSEKAINRYLEDNVNTWRLKTREHYKSVANVFFEFLCGREVSELLVREFLQGIKNTRHATTYNKYRATLKRLFDNVGATYLFEGIKPLKAISTPARYFQTYQAMRLSRHIKESDERLWLFVQLIYYCFIRPGELRLIQVGDFMLDDREIRIAGEKAKNKKTEYVAIPDVFFPSLDFLYYEEPGKYLFQSNQSPSKPVGKNFMYNQHQRILNELNFPKGYSLYSWKHTGAVAAAKAGIGMKELQLQLRHHSLDQTDQYLRQMGIRDVDKLRYEFPEIGIKRMPLP